MTDFGKLTKLSHWYFKKQFQILKPLWFSCARLWPCQIYCITTWNSLLASVYYYFLQLANTAELRAIIVISQAACIYKEVGMQMVGEGGQLEVGHILCQNRWTSYESKKCQPQIQTQGSILGPCLLHSTLYWSYCLSHEFTWSAKLTLDKRTSQPSLVMAM